MSVVALRNRLTQDDIRRLVKGENEEVRASAAQKICRRMDAANLTDAERGAARDILDLIARDAAKLTPVQHDVEKAGGTRSGASVMCVPCLCVCVCACACVRACANVRARLFSCAG